MTEQEILDLLDRGEGETLDFKEEAYKFDCSEAKSKFVKDVISMANTPRSEDARIVIGVRKKADGSYDVLGLQSHPDQAELQAQVERCVYPVPPLRYAAYTVSGSSIGIITIPVRKGQPFLPIREVGVLREHALYFRRESVNALANGEEQKRIHAWFAPPSPLPAPSTTDYGTTPWAQFVEAAHGFERGRVFLLAIDRVPETEELTNLGLPHWAGVIDLDPDTQTSGVLRLTWPLVSRRLQVHIVTRGERPALNIDRATYWFAARGLAGRPDTLVGDSWLEWNEKYGNELRATFVSLAREAAGRPVTIVSLCSHPDYVQSLFEAAHAAFGAAVEFVVALPDPSPLVAPLRRFNPRAVAVSFEGIGRGLQSHFADRDAPGAAPAVRLPHRDGVDKDVPPEHLPWLLEEMDLVHFHSGDSEPPERETGRDFLRGAEPTWYEIGLHYDVERDMTDAVLRRIEEDLRKPQATRVNLCHSGGAGGTTVSRRVAWQVHHRFPVVLLRRSRPAETVERLAWLAALTALPLLVVAEGAALTDRQIDELFSALRARHIPAVLFQVLRRFAPPQARDRTFWLAAELSPAEARRFAYTFSRESPVRASRLERLAERERGRYCTPFYFGLEAFGREFRGLQSYVETRLAAATVAHREMLIYIALAHHFAQQSLPAQAFAPLLGLPPSRLVRFADCFPVELQELLIHESDGTFRTAHDLIAEEVLCQLLAPQASDRRVWKQNLSTWACRFAEFSRGTLPVVSEHMMDVMRRTFIYRDNTELLGSERAAAPRFAQLVEEIPAKEGRLTVFRTLTELFPDEPHFWAHLGRFYATEINEFAEAADAVDRAIALSPADHVLYHMRGMVLRSQAYAAMESKRSIDGTLGLVRAASEEFGQARNLAPSDEHGYISEVQMLLRFADYAAAQSGEETHEFLASVQCDPWVREIPVKAEELLDAVARQRVGEHESPYEATCRVRLDRLYGDHQAVLQGWDRLLARPDVYKPPIRRQLVWTYLARRGRSWDALEPREVQRAVGLLEQNIDEAPHESGNIRLWVQGVRRLPHPPSLEAVIERVSYWAANSQDIDALYYLYVFQALKAFEGSTLALEACRRSLEKCRNEARERPNRTRSFEWVGKGTGIARLVHRRLLGQWDDASAFWSDTSRLSRIAAVISSIGGPQAGRVLLQSGLDAFFVPGRDSIRGRDENTRVSCFVGFSYDGLRAWEVRPNDAP